jgi:DNA-binding protein YbaB
MTAETDRTDEMLRQLQRFSSTIEDQQHRMETASFTATDEDKTVEVTLDGRNRVTGLFIENGLLRLGPETVTRRLNEALANAQAEATTANEADQEQLVTSLVGIADELQKHFPELEVGLGQA